MKGQVSVKLFNISPYSRIVTQFSYRDIMLLNCHV
uniref:Uncharacterized protein n=1 Tax=Anguilla anguilla TaxID=7936 RepID=A0A0E9RLT7_ANGAN